MEGDSFEYRKCSEKQVERIIGIFQRKFKTSSRWSIEEIEVNRIIPLCKYVYTHRLNYAEMSISNCEKYNIPLFYPYVVHYSNGKNHLVVPPIVEERNKLLYLGDGMHRIYKLLQQNVTTTLVLMTHDCVLDLPGRPQTWVHVKETDNQLPGHMNFDCFSRQGLTGYSKFCNSDFFWSSWEE